MPYTTETYTPPTLPPSLITQSKTFDDLRMKVAGIVNYLQQLNSSGITYFQHLQENINQNATTEGINIAAALTIQVFKFMHVITGNGAVETIITPRGFSGQLMLISRDGFELVSGGNISMIQSPNVLPPGAHILLTWVPSRSVWYADSCRLQGAPGGGGGGGAGTGVLVTPALSGPGIHIDPSTYIISNIGVLSLIAGAGISVSGATGNVTVSTGGGTNGQIPIGVTGSPPVLSTLTAGTNISITNGAGSITIASPTQPLWTIVTTSTTPYTVASGHNVYVRGSATAGAAQVVNLPASTGSGWMVLVKKMDSNAQNVVVTAAGADTIDGAATNTLTTQYSRVQIIDAASGAWDVIT